MIYKGITSFRNYLFDKGILKEFSPDIFSIGVGNLTVGGTGKTPMVNCLISILKGRKIAVISRGYGRKTKGFIALDASSTPETVGDEPFMLAKNNPGTHFFVSEKRVEGYKLALENTPDINTFIFDDVFQHRYLKPSLNILLCDYHRPFYKDSLLPLGKLRESRSGAKRADVVVVTKCPADLSEHDKIEIEKEIRKYAHTIVKVYFAVYEVGEPHNYLGQRVLGDVVLISALGNNSLFYEQQKKKYNVLEHFAFRDHFSISREKLVQILEKYPDSNIITTEKDMVKIASLLSEKEKARFYVAVVTVKIDDTFRNYILQS